MLNFTVGPVMTWDEILDIGGQQVPYFRTAEFSELMFENEQMMLKYTKAEEGSRCAFLTGSGTMGMEAAVINTLTKNDKALIVNGGGFGRRFVELCELHKIPFDAINLDCGRSLTCEELKKYSSGDYTAFIVNMHETSTGVLYDMTMISDFCRKNDIYLIVDAISAFMADPVDMSELGIDVLITSSQKAFACAPGISMLTLSPRAIKKVEAIKCSNMYMDIGLALKNGERGQTPFTPAVATLIQINKRLKMIENRGGIEGECNSVENVAMRFRKGIEGLPFEIVCESPSNAITALHPTNGLSARAICDRMKDEFGIWICPNGGDMADYMFRVGHIGNITSENVDELINALKKVIENN